VQRPLPALAVERPSRCHLPGVRAGVLRAAERLVVVEVELLHHDGGMRAAPGKLGKQPCADHVMRRVVVNFAEQAVTCRREVGDQRRLGHEALRVHVVDSCIRRRRRWRRRTCRQHCREQRSQANAMTR